MGPFWNWCRPPHHRSQSRNRRGVDSRYGLAPVAALLALLASASWMAFRRSSDSPLKPTQFLVAPPKGYYLEGGGIRQSLALSPDGARMAFTAKDASGAFRLFLRDFSELESRPVADGEGAYSVVWTPDGRMLLFTAKGKLRRIAVNAAASQILSDADPVLFLRDPFWSGPPARLQPPQLGRDSLVWRNAATHRSVVRLGANAPWRARLSLHH